MLPGDGGSGEQTIARKSESFRYKRVRGVCPIGPPGNSCRCNACRFHSMEPTVSMERAGSASQIHLIEFDEVHSGSGGSAQRVDGDLVVFAAAEYSVKRGGGRGSMFAAIVGRIGRLRLAVCRGEVRGVLQSGLDVIPVRRRCAAGADFAG